MSDVDQCPPSAKTDNVRRGCERAKQRPSETQIGLAMTRQIAARNFDVRSYFGGRSKFRVKAAVSFGCAGLASGYESPATVGDGAVTL